MSRKSSGAALVAWCGGACEAAPRRFSFSPAILLAGGVAAHGHRSNASTAARHQKRGGRRRQ